MCKSRFTMLFAVVAALGLFAASARSAEDAAAVAEKEAKLIGVLASDAPGAQKAIACKELALYGSGKAAPQLAPLLANEQLASWARIALEAIPGPEADAALRDSVATLEGRLLIGAINSIGVRRDAKAVEVLSDKLSDKNAAVASAAAVALGHIGDASATKVLRAALADAAKETSSAVAEGCILCAEKLMNTGRSDDAAKIYDEVRTAKVPKPRVVEATRGAILARKAGGVPLLMEQIRSPDRAFYYIGLSTARELPGKEATEAIAAELANVSEDHAAVLLTVLGDRNDPTAAPAVLKAVKSNSKRVRIAAIGILGKFADESSVPTLLEIAADDDAELSEAAKTTLVGLEGAKVNLAITAGLQKAEGKSLLLLIELVGQRRIDATSELVKALDNSDANIRSAALVSLGETAAQKDLNVLITRAIESKRDEDTATAQKALKAAAVRMPDREKCAEELSSALAKASAKDKSLLLEILGGVAGEKALTTLATAAKGDNDDLKDTATRMLGGWMTVDAGPVLLDLAKTSKEEKYQVRALRGYIRLARQFAKSHAQRAEMCGKALESANRDAERELVLNVLELYPSVDGLKVAVKATKNEKLKDEATKTSLVIAQKLGGKADTKDLLAQIGQVAVKLEIVKAEYGAGDRKKDVTDVVRKAAGVLPLIALKSTNYNNEFGGDPAPNTPKQLRIQYKINGAAGDATFPENGTIILPIPK
jgi:HEAT repeat protein